jgi:hypothetical protein
MVTKFTYKMRLGGKGKWGLGLGLGLGRGGEGRGGEGDEKVNQRITERRRKFAFLKFSKKITSKIKLRKKVLQIV